MVKTADAGSNKFSAVGRLFFPESLKSATAPEPGGDTIAQMVSFLKAEALWLAIINSFYNILHKNTIVFKSLS